MKLRVFLSRLVATLTGAPRYFPSETWEGLEWSNGALYTHDFFRVLEWVFGRRVGVRKEVSIDFDEKKQVVIYHTFESKCWKLETDIRNTFKKIFEPVRVVSVQTAGTPFSFPTGVLAAAIAESSNNGQASSTTLNIGLTVGGAGRVFLCGRMTYNPTTPNWSFAGLGISNLNSSGNNAVVGYAYNPAAGGQTFQITANTSSFLAGCAAIFSGTNGVGSTGSSNSSSASITIAGNSTAVGVICYNPSGSTPSSMSCNQTLVTGTKDNGEIGMAAVGSGTVSFSVGGSPTLIMGIVECKAPAASMMFSFFGAMAGSPA